MSSPYYRSQAWRALRAECLALQPICASPGCGRPSEAADHIQPRSKGGPDVLENLRALCLRCHNQRRQGGEPRAVGCDAAGNPRDRTHWWNTQENLSSPRGRDRPGDHFPVSSTSGFRRR